MYFNVNIICAVPLYINFINVIHKAASIEAVTVIEVQSLSRL